MTDHDESWVADRLRAGSVRMNVAAKSGFVGGGERDLILLDANRGLLAVIEVKGWTADMLRGTAKSENHWEVVSVRYTHGRRPGTEA